MYTYRYFANTFLIRPRKRIKSTEVVNTIKSEIVNSYLPIAGTLNFVKELKKINPQLPIVAQTAYSTQADIQRAFKAGCDDFISKPVDPAAISKVLQRFLN